MRQKQRRYQLPVIRAGLKLAPHNSKHTLEQNTLISIMHNFATLLLIRNYVKGALNEPKPEAIRPFLLKGVNAHDNRRTEGCPG